MKSWFKILHQRQAGGGACSLAFDTEFLPDASIRYFGTLSDCTTFDYVFHPPDYSGGEGTRIRPNGEVVTSTWTAVAWAGLSATQDIEEEHWDAARVTRLARLDYSLSVDFGAPGFPQTWDGSLVLPDARSMRFVLNRSQEVEDHLQITLANGSQLEVRAPLEAVTGTLFWPVFSQGANGVFRPPSGRQLGFTITGGQDVWDRWEFTSSDGIEGGFTLDVDFGGSGLLVREDGVIGALRWMPDGSGTLEPVAAEAADVAPSAAARDFQIDRWVSTIAAMGPGPMF